MDIEKELIDPEQLLPLLEEEAKKKSLKVFVFNNEEVRKHFNVKSEKIAVALLAQNEDNALINLKNLKRCYLIKDSTYAVCDKIEPNEI